MTTQRHVVAAVLASLALSVLSSLAVGTDSPIDAPVSMPKQPASATLTQAQCTLPERARARVRARLADRSFVSAQTRAWRARRLAFTV